MRCINLRSCLANNMPLKIRALSRHLCQLLLSVSLFINPPAMASNLSFALFGDVYMTAEHQGYLKGMLDDMARKGSELAISTGGLKPADQSCQDKNLLAAYPVFLAAPLPTFYVPGDADWALCGQAAGGNFAPEERLNLLRQTFYQSDRSLGDPQLPLVRQADYPEHMRWRSGPALFISLNVPGDPIKGNKPAEDAQSLQARTNAVLSWIKAAYSEASKQEINMLVMVMHGDPAFATPEAGAPQTTSPMTDLLQSETEQFAGQVLLVHGGSGVHRIDQPLMNQRNESPLQNFTRVETYSALQQGWVQVRIERNKKSGDDPVHRTEFLFESFPWPPLDMSGEAESTDNAN